MLYLRRWQTAPALVVALGVVSSAIAPMISTSAAATPAPYSVAQLFPSAQPTGVAIPAGTNIPVRYTGSEKFVVAPTESRALSLSVARNIRSSYGDLLIPAGSEVQGRLVPVNGGAQFVADSLLLPNGTRLAMNANSNLITTKDVQGDGINGDAILKGTAIGAAGSTVVSAIAGRKRVTLGKVLLGAGAGAVGGLLLGKKPSSDAIAIKPSTDLTLTLNSRLALNSGYPRY